MRKVKSDDLRPVYKREDLGLEIRGKYLESYKKGTNLVLLSPDVAKVFASEDAVNEALRSLIDVAQRTVKLGKHSKAPLNRFRRKMLNMGFVQDDYRVLADRIEHGEQIPELNEVFPVST